MKLHIDTIPVWDAIRQGGPCFLCTMRDRSEATWAERFLGASVMEPEWRIRVNRHGFCARHHQLLYGMGNRLGHALMLESHMHETTAAMNEALARAGKAADAMGRGGLGRSKARQEEAYRAAVQDLGTMAEDCILCAHMAEDTANAVGTVLHLWQHDGEFRSVFAGCAGFCLPHLHALLADAPDLLPAKELPGFIDALTRIEGPAYETMGSDVSWFIKKFEYRYQAEPWKNARDAVPRAVNLLRGRTLPADEGESSRDGGE